MDDTEQLVVRDIFLRQMRGMAKYGKTVAENPLPFREWLQHAYEEMLDGAVYLKRIMQELDAKQAEAAGPVDDE